MSAYQKVVDVTAVLSYPVDPQVEVPFEPARYYMYDESVSASVDFSFDGINDHGQLKLEAPNQSIQYKAKTRKVWFKRASAGIDAASVRVMVSNDI